MNLKRKLFFQSFYEFDLLIGDFDFGPLVGDFGFNPLIGDLAEPLHCPRLVDFARILVILRIIGIAHGPTHDSVGGTCKSVRSDARIETCSKMNLWYSVGLLYIWLCPNYLTHGLFIW